MSSSSPGTGADLTAQEAADLLRKLITESTKVQAMLSTPLGLRAGVAGFVQLAPNGCVGVVPEQAPQSANMAPKIFALFNPSLAVRYKYGDRRASCWPCSRWRF